MEQGISTWCSILSVEILVEMLCLCSLAKSKTAIVLLDEEWLRPPDMEYRKHESYVMTTVS
jgi:hypothetical protein